MKRRYSSYRLGIGLLLFVCKIQLAFGQPLFTNSFEDQFGFPESDQQAARFLIQATFGVTRPELEQLTELGYRQWIRHQVELPATLLREELQSLPANGGLIQTLITKRDRENLWMKAAVTGEDQLRQRVAFAFSQIFVISARDPVLDSSPVQMAEFQDLLVRNAFGNYRELLEQVSRQPVMAQYLSFLRNRKQQTIVRTGVKVAPDENYAREVMQLFSIGLFERNQDFSLVDADPVAAGIQPLPTYDENVVANLARVFTGFSYQCNGGEFEWNGQTLVRDCGANSAITCSGTRCNFLGVFGSVPLSHPDGYSPMICYPAFHDIGRDPDNAEQPYPSRPAAESYPDEPYRDKRIVGHWPGIGSGPLPMFDEPEGCAVLATAQRFNNPLPDDEQRRQACIDYCEGELAQALDALFYHPNTAPTFARRMIQFLVTSNPSPDYIERVADVFDNNGNGVRGDIGAVVEAILMDNEARRPVADSQFGKLREPLVKLTSLYRSLGFFASSNRWGGRDPGLEYQAFGQVHMFSPTVFNFFSPDFAQPGPISDGNLVSPEFEVFDQNTSVRTVNAFRSRICAGWGALRNEGAVETTTSDCRKLGNFQFRQPVEQPYLPPEALNNLPTDDAALIDELDLLLFAGRMSGSYAARSGMKGTLRKYLETTDDDNRQRILLNTIALTLASPQFAVQR